MFAGYGIDMTYEGKPFDPIAQAPDVDTTLSAEERPIGGLGIFLIRQIMDHVSYQYQDGSNILTMKKQITDNTPQTK